MNQKYSRQDLIKELIKANKNRRYIYGEPTVYLLAEKPESIYFTCYKCTYPRVPVVFHRYGDGTQYCVHWIAETWVGSCPRNCDAIMIYIKLMDYEELARENLRILSEICEKEIKCLSSSRI